MPFMHWKQYFAPIHAAHMHNAGQLTWTANNLSQVLHFCNASIPL